MKAYGEGSPFKQAMKRKKDNKQPVNPLMDMFDRINAGGRRGLSEKP